VPLVFFGLSRMTMVYKHHTYVEYHAVWDSGIPRNFVPGGFNKFS